MRKREVEKGGETAPRSSHSSRGIIYCVGRTDPARCVCVCLSVCVCVCVCVSVFKYMSWVYTCLYGAGSWLICMPICTSDKTLLHRPSAAHYLTF